MTAFSASETVILENPSGGSGRVVSLSELTREEKRDMHMPGRGTKPALCGVEPGNPLVNCMVAIFGISNALGGCH